MKKLLGLIFISVFLALQASSFQKEASKSRIYMIEKDFASPEGLVEKALSPTVLTSCECGRRRSSRIVGGETSNDNEFPFIARLNLFGRFFCGGTLVSDQFILTAAHCTRKRSALSLTALLGANYEGQEGGLTVRVLQIIDHPRNNAGTNDLDLSLLRVSAINFQHHDRIRPACLPHQKLSFEGKKATAAGWGYTAEGGPLSDDLQAVEVPVLSNSECQEKYSLSSITKNMLCAGKGGKDACQGDSGGPLLYKRWGGVYWLIGVTSFGRGCARPEFPGVYARVTAASDWIKETISASNTCATPGPE